MSFLWVVFVLLHFLAQALTEVRMGIGFTVIFPVGFSAARVEKTFEI